MQKPATQHSRTDPRSTTMGLTDLYRLDYRPICLWDVDRLYRGDGEIMTPRQIAKIRRRLGLTRTEFARELNVSYITVWRWETGKMQVHPAREERLEELRRASS